MSTFDVAAAAVARHSIQRVQDALDMLQPDTSWNRLCREGDPARVARVLAHENKLFGADAEISDELARRRPLTNGQAYLAYETLAFRAARQRASMTRADIVGSTTQGGFLVETANFPSAASALLSMLVLGRLGATAVDAGGPNLALPKVDTSATPMWLSTETTQVTEVEQAFGQLAFSPHTVGGYTELSHLLSLQSRPDAGDVVALDLARKVARFIEAAAFAGSGTAGQPHGIVGLTGVGAVSGATYALATGMTATTDTGDALTDDANPGWVATRTVASLLRQRQEFSGSPLTLWRGALTWGQLHDFPAAGTSGCPTGTAIFGNWRYLTLVNWGGLEVAVNPFAQGNFQAGIIGIRAFATIDVGTVWPGAFTAVTGIT